MNLRRFVKNRVSLVGFFVILILLLLAVLAPWISNQDPLKHNIANRFASPSWQHPGGTDGYGRDIFSRTIWGARSSIFIGFLSTFAGALIGTVLGLIAGYNKGKISGIIVWFTDVLMSFPTMVLAIIVVVAFGAGTVNVVLAIGFAFMPRFVRLARASTLSITEQVFIEASKAIGQFHWRILGGHILPNIAGELVVMSTLWVATAIRLEASLSFLGMGTQPPTPSWGLMIKDGMDFFIGFPWLCLIPGLGIFLASMGFNMLGDGVRDILDPKLRGRLVTT